MEASALTQASFYSSLFISTSRTLCFLLPCVIVLSPPHHASLRFISTTPEGEHQHFHHSEQNVASKFGTDYPWLTSISEPSYCSLPQIELFPFKTFHYLTNLVRSSISFLFSRSGPVCSSFPNNAHQFLVYLL